MQFRTEKAYVRGLAGGALRGRPKTGLFSFQMRSDELKCMEALEEKCTVSKWWMPLVWATSIILEARKENRFRFVSLFLTQSHEIGMNDSATYRS